MKNLKELSNEVIKEIRELTHYQIAAKYELTCKEARAIKELFEN